MPGGNEVSEEIEHAVHENKGIALLHSRRPAAKAHRPKQLVKTSSRQICGLFSSQGHSCDDAANRRRNARDQH
jgi:hypothetical protein